MIRDAQAWKHTNHYYTGSEDLDANGKWESAPDYGEVWVPNESDGWAPYRDGNWVWETDYGWTWVGYEPWGWAPYHYGRWMWYGNSWAWWPGPVWAGLLPSVLGAGLCVVLSDGVGALALGWGGFGWLPIGPCDCFHPWWGGDRGRFGVVGRGGFNRYGGFAPLHAGTRFSNVSHFNDPHIGRALSTVKAGHFGTGRASAVAATGEQLSGARMMAGNLPVVPTHASLSASGRAAGAIDHSQRWSAAFLRHAEHGATGVVPAAGVATAVVDAAEPCSGSAGREGDDASGLAISLPGLRKDRALARVRLAGTRLAGR